ncbi:MarR family transcriptional regulator [Streptomyces olivoreticuli]|uniref:MarR family transcriptional regulator n=1 Tax=Streptomyces blastmyceticus TaxID=68180 RepID=A0ABN0Y4Z3_9ACTN|nr:MarR family transcriptional regulator [Streptomyces olivoreticuli]WKK23461.1 MarR family transcriptional regulator [Streptomyces olivoreticuli]
MTIKEYTREELAAQPIGHWSGEAHRAVVGRLRAELAVEELTQPHWWTLNHVAGAPGTWDRARLTERLRPFDDLGIDFEAVYDDLFARGWMREEAGRLTLTAEGEAGRIRAAERNRRAHEQMHAGIAAEEYAAAVDVLRRMVANLGGAGDLP